MLQGEFNAKDLSAEGAAYLWSTWPDVRVDLAENAALSEDLRVTARTWPRADVRSAFARREDLTAQEISDILGSEKSAAVLAALCTRPMDPKVLASLATEGKKATMNSLLTNWRTVELLKSPTAVELVLGRADSEILTDTLTPGRTDSACALARSLDVSYLEQMTSLPRAGILRESLLGNPNIWLASNRAMFIKAASGFHELNELERSIGRHPDVTLTDEEAAYLRNRLASGTGRTRLRKAAFPPGVVDEEALKAAEALRLETQRKERIALLNEWVAGADPVLAKAAMKELFEVNPNYQVQAFSPAAKALKAALDSPVVAQEQVLKLWGKRLPEKFELAELADPRTILSIELEGKYPATRNIHACLRAKRGQPMGRVLSLWVASNAERINTVSSGGVASVLDDCDPVAYPLLSMKIVNSLGERGARVRTWAVNALAGIAARTGADPMEIHTLATSLGRGETLTLGEVLEAVEAGFAPVQVEEAEVGRVFTRGRKSGGVSRSPI